jgi:hypothetical protein
MRREAEGRVALATLITYAGETAANKPRDAARGPSSCRILVRSAEHKNQQNETHEVVCHDQIIYR